MGLRAPSGTKLHMRETRFGTWVVREEGDRRGGSFFTRNAALKFIRQEFGANAHIIERFLVQKVAA
jgi:hypothetical protein